MAKFIEEPIPYENTTRTLGIEFDNLTIAGTNGRIEALTPVFECEGGRLIQVDLTPDPSVEWYEPTYNNEMGDSYGLSANRIQQILHEQNVTRYCGDGRIVKDDDGNYTEFEPR